MASLLETNIMKNQLKWEKQLLLNIIYILQFQQRRRHLLLDQGIGQDEVNNLQGNWRKYQLNQLEYRLSWLSMATDFTIEQLELFTQLTIHVGIVPSFSDEELYLLSGEIRQFKANNEITVPLWLAILFKKQQKCKIMAPYYMKEDNLQGLYNAQIAEPECNLINLHEPQFFEIGYIILNNAPDDLVNPTKIRNLLDSLKDVREKIILKKLKNKGGFLISNVTTYQINKFRKAKYMVMEELSELNKIKDLNEER